MPNRGEVWLVDLGLAGKTRPALILSKPFGHADRALLTIIPHTLSLRGSQFEVAVPVPFLRGGAFPSRIRSRSLWQKLNASSAAFPQPNWRLSRLVFAAG